ncbi:MAG: OmpR family two-component response regulator [Dehalococcoidia bacterium]|nr:OmpR family two-component response regulator [Dehalococcoidia bacterium]
MKDTTILAVDDEVRYLRLLRFNLEAGGYRVATAANGEEALTGLAMEEPDLVILDLMMPDIDGFEVLRRLREFSMTPVIILTAKGEESDKIKGLRLGADDYVTKPFSAQELLARVEAVLRRTQLQESANTPGVLEIGDLHIDFPRHQVSVAEQEVKLTPTEYRVLQCLALNADKVVVQSEILRRVWGPEYLEEYEGLRVYIRRLRQKLEKDPDQPTLIRTVPGVGYILRSPSEVADKETIVQSQ